VRAISAIIKPFKLDEVKEALDGIGIVGMTVIEVRGFGRQKGHHELHRAEYTVDFLPKVMMVVLVRDGDAEHVMETISLAARTGSIGDGIIWSDYFEEYRTIRTDERHREASSLKGAEPPQLLEVIERLERRLWDVEKAMRDSPYWVRIRRADLIGLLACSGLIAGAIVMGHFYVGDDRAFRAVTYAVLLGVFGVFLGRVVWRVIGR
jgi:nitrogen regulatory protein PII